MNVDVYLASFTGAIGVTAFAEIVVRGPKLQRRAQLETTLSNQTANAKHSLDVQTCHQSDPHFRRISRSAPVRMTALRAQNPARSARESEVPPHRRLNLHPLESWALLCLLHPDFGHGQAAQRAIMALPQPVLQDPRASSAPLRLLLLSLSVLQTHLQTTPIAAMMTLGLRRLLLAHNTVVPLVVIALRLRLRYLTGTRSIRRRRINHGATNG